MIGLAYEKLNQLDSSAFYLNKSYNTQKSNVRILEDLSRVEYKMDSLDIAFEHINILLDEVKEAKNFNMRGLIRLKLKDTTNACVDFKTAYLIDNNFSYVNQFCE